MKRLLAIVGLSLGLCGTLWAQEPSAGAAVPLAPAPAVGNNPGGAFTIGKAIVDYLQPSYETVWDIGSGTWSQGVSGSVYNLTSNEIHLLSLRLGYATDQILYSSLKLDLPGLSERFVPASVAGVATTKPLDTLWGIVGKYAAVGVFAGYSWAQDDPAFGLTLGASVKF